MVFTLEREHAPTVYVIYDWLIVPWPCISQLCYASYAACAIEAIQELSFHLPLAIDELKDGIARTIYQSVSFNASITTCSDKISNVLFGLTQLPNC